MTGWFELVCCPAGDADAMLFGRKGLCILWLFSSLRKPRSKLFGQCSVGPVVTFTLHLKHAGGISSFE